MNDNKNVNMESLLPPMRCKMAAKTIGQDIVGMRPDETWEHALERHNYENLLRERRNKIEKIIKKYETNRSIHN